MFKTEKEAIILEYLYYDDSLKQRELADKAGISLGMTNAILKRLIDKGWLMVRRLNSRNISYVVSPAGIEEIIKRSYRYFKRTINDVRMYNAGIEQLVSEIVAAKYRTLVLVGKSDLDFLVEFACSKAKLKFMKSDNYDRANKYIFVLYSEQYEIGDKANENHWLQSIIMRQK